MSLPIEQRRKKNRLGFPELQIKAKRAWMFCWFLKLQWAEEMLWALSQKALLCLNLKLSYERKAFIEVWLYKISLFGFSSS